MSAESTLAQLQDWYDSQCDGEWEGQYGITIETIANPGWAVRIDVSDTYLAGRSFPRIDEAERSEDDWVFCRKKDDVFHGQGGPGNLEEILGAFLGWAIENLPG